MEFIHKKKAEKARSKMLSDQVSLSISRWSQWWYFYVYSWNTVREFQAQQVWRDYCKHIYQFDPSNNPRPFLGRCPSYEGQGGQEAKGGETGSQEGGNA